MRKLLGATDVFPLAFRRFLPIFRGFSAFSDKHRIQVREITAEESKESAVWLTKAENDPAKHGTGR